ncbi:MAG: rhodanese-like domain-containing protein [Solibacillus sp.]|jgi:rhodanese-related sulfurtransferase|uniref:rhodanese-like domain-containing protein n=1 Tax=unclassified Solibacillus TaxID=2637870 RepID=UPI0030F787EB
MEGIITLIAILLIIVMTYRFMPTKGVKYITTKELQPLLNDERYVFVDVRTVKEYKEAHIPNFINRPRGAYLGDLPKDRPIVVICQSGVRSNQACKELVKLGYTDVTNVRRGMNALRAG